MRSTTWALVGAGGLYILFQVVWGFIPLIVRYVANGFSLPDMTSIPNWSMFFSLLRPQTAFDFAAAAVIPEASSNGDIFGVQAFYLQNWVGFVVLAAWIVVPLGFGYLRFNSTDL